MLKSMVEIHFPVESATESPPPSSSKKSESMRLTTYVLSVEMPTSYPHPQIRRFRAIGFCSAFQNFHISRSPRW